jgi:alkane 1-monooxygenase
MPWRYAFTLVFPVMGLVGIFVGGWTTLLLPLVAFGAIPLAELVMSPQRANYTDAQEAAVAANPWFDRVLYSIVAAHVGVLAAFLWQVSAGAVTGWHLVGATIDVGVLCGALGINVGHELGHRRDRFQQGLAKLLLFTSLYGHFFVEHNRGHHVFVATERDPATSRRGESLYAFVVRSVVLGLRSAWRLEAERLAKRGGSAWSWQNETLRLLVGQAVLVAAVAAVFGPVATGAWAVAAAIGISTLEVVNYIEHYGLVRGRKPSGRLEPVRPVHSWNSDHPLGRVVLFELTRHADHHASPHRPYPVLRHLSAGPQLPTGYPGMMVLATVPPLFFRVMHPRLDAWKAQAAA